MVWVASVIRHCNRLCSLGTVLLPSGRVSLARKSDCGVSLRTHFETNREHKSKLSAPCCEGRASPSDCGVSALDCRRKSKQREGARKERDPQLEQSTDILRIQDSQLGKTLNVSQIDVYLFR